MDDMTATPAHAKPARRDHLWVLVLIAACCLIKVWPSWVGIGAEARFPEIGQMPTDWTLAVVIEAYWAYAVYAWIAAPAGRHSRRFALGSAAVVFVLSLIGQSAAQVMAATVVKVFANALPVIVLALVAVLVHLRQADRAEAEDAVRQAEAEVRRIADEAAAADERTALRAELEALTAEVGPLREALSAAQRETAEVTAKAEVLTRKLAAAAGRKRTPQKAGGKTAAAPRSKTAKDPATEVPNDVDAQAEALSILAAEPNISGAKLAERVGMSERWGQTFKKNLAGTAGPATGATP